MTRVLFADEDAAFRERIVTYLRGQQQMQVDVCGSVAALMKLVADPSRSYDVLLIERDLPLVDGAAIQLVEPLVLEQIRAARPYMRVIQFVAGYDNPNVLERVHYKILHNVQLPELGMLVQAWSAEAGRELQKHLLSQLMEVGTALLNSRNLSDILQKIVTAIDAIGFDRARIFLPSDDKERCVLRYASGMEFKPGAYSETDEEIEALHRRHETDTMYFYRRDAVESGGEHLLLNRDGVREWVTVPLRMDGQIVGKISADNQLSNRPIAPEALEPIVVFAGMAAMSIEQARLAESEEEQRTKAEDRAEMLDALLQLSNELNSPNRQPTNEDPIKIIVAKAIENAVTLFDDIDQGGSALFDSSGTFATVESGYPGRDVIGQRIQIEGIPAEEQVFWRRQPFQTHNVVSDPALGSVGKMLFEKYNIRSILIVPIVYREEVIGSLSLDSTKENRLFTEEEIEICEIFAAQVGTAIKNARLLADVQRRNAQLDSMRATALALTEKRDSRAVLEQILRASIKLLGAQRAGIYAYRKHRRDAKLELIDGHATIPKVFISAGEGMIGRMIESGERYMVEPHYEDSPYVHEIPQAAHSKGSVIVMSLHAQNALVGFLYVEDVRDRPYTERDIGLLEMFCDHGAIAFEKAQLEAARTRVVRQLEVLNEISDYVEAEQDIHVIMQTLLTGVTAGYGLGFNAAALLLVKHDVESGQRILRGILGIGHILESEAEADWDRQDDEGICTFKEYLSRRQAGLLQPSPMEGRIEGLSVSLTEDNDNRLASIVNSPEHRCYSIQPQEFDQLPENFRKQFVPQREPLVVVQLRARDQVLGLLVADYRFASRAITKDVQRALKTFVNSASVAYENVQLLGQTRIERNRLREMFAASQMLVSTEEVGTVLRQVVEQMASFAGADGAIVGTVDRFRRFTRSVGTGMDREGGSSTLQFRPNGYSKQVLNTGVRVVIPNAATFPDVSDTWQKREIYAAVCLPLIVRKQTMGVVWLHYRNPRQFDMYEVDIWQLFANQLGIVLDNTRRLRQRKQMVDATRQLVGIQEKETTLRAIVENAKRVLEAQSVLLWIFDEGRMRFVRGESIMDGIDDADWQSARKMLPRTGGTAQQIIEKRYLEVRDIDNPQQTAALGSGTLHFCKRLGIRSFQAVRLQVGSENFGVLYFNYDQVGSFRESDRRKAEVFAGRAALALQSARRFERMNAVHQFINRIAEAIARGLDGTLHQSLEIIVKAAVRILEANAVVLYPYDRKRKRFVEPVAMDGIRNRTEVRTPADLQDDAPPFTVLRRKTAVIVENVMEDELFNGRFAQAEEIRSLAGLPLRVRNRTVGVMFINFREPRTFSEEVRELFQLFANHAAMAIDTVHQGDALRRRYGAFRAIEKAALSISQEADLEVILQQIVSHAMELTRTAGREDHTVLCDVLLRDGHILVRRAELPTDEAVDRKVPEVDLRADQNGVVGKAFRTGKTQLVGNVATNGDYVLCNEATRSEMAVPIMLRGRAIGVINLEFDIVNGCEMLDRRTFEALAGAAATAIDKHRQIRQNEVLRDASRAVGLNSAGSQLGMWQQLLRVGVANVKPVGGAQVKWSIVQTVEHQKDNGLQMRLADVHPRSEFAKLKTFAEEERKPGAGKFGVTGRAVRTKQPQIVNDVGDDRDYISFDDAIQSEIAVPIVSNERVLGVISLESEQENAFDEEDRRVLEALAELARLTLQHQQMQERVLSTAALAQMGMVTTNWHHSTMSDAQVILENGMLMQADLETGDYEQVRSFADEIVQTAREIKDREIVPQLSFHRGVESVSISRLVREQMERLESAESYRPIAFVLHLLAEDEITVRASSDWLQIVWKRIAENAREAMQGMSEAQLTVTTEVIENGETIEIRFADVGSGIPAHIRPKLLRSPIDKTRRSKGSGIGLLMAQLIVQTYGGSIRFEDNEPRGTVMIVTLPVEKEA